MGGKNGEKTGFHAFFCQIIWSIQKKAVPLHPLLPNDQIVNDQMVNGFVHSYIGITPDFGSEKRGSTPRWTTKKGKPLPAPPHKGGNLMKRGSCDGIRAATQHMTFDI